MNHQKSPLVLVALLSVSLSACVINVGSDEDTGWQKQEKLNRQHVANLGVGMKLDVVKQMLGSPDFSEAYPDGAAQVEVLFYRTQRRHDDGKTTLDECTPLVFNNGSLIGWGNTAYSQVTTGKL